MSMRSEGSKIVICLFFIHLSNLDTNNAHYVTLCYVQPNKLSICDDECK